MATEYNNAEDGKPSEMRSNGFSVWPLSSEQLELIRGFFAFADNLINVGKPFNPSDLFPADDDVGNPMEELRFIMSETIVVGKFVDGTVIYYTDPALLPPVQIEFITVAVAIERDYPRASNYAPDPTATPPYPGELDANWLVLHLLGGIPGATGATGADGGTGATGETGAPGADSTVPGPQGPPGNGCEPCGSGGGGSGQTGPTGQDGGGSGPDGGPNPDGGDWTVYVPCDNPLIDVAFGSAGFSYDNFDLRGSIVSAVTASGSFDATHEDLISCVLSFEGLGFGGITVLSIVDTLPFTEDDYIATVLRVTDATGWILFPPYNIEQVGIPDVITISGIRYSGFTGIALTPATEPILLNGQVASPPIGWTNHDPPNADDPAWLKVCLVSFIKHILPVSLNLCGGTITAADPHRVWNFDAWRTSGVPFYFNCWGGWLGRGGGTEYTYPGANAAFINNAITPAAALDVTKLHVKAKILTTWDHTDWHLYAVIRRESDGASYASSAVITVPAMGQSSLDSAWQVVDFSSFDIANGGTLGNTIPAGEPFTVYLYTTDFGFWVHEVEMWLDA